MKKKKKNRRIVELITGGLLVSTASILLFCYAAGSANAAPTDWIRSEDGLPPPSGPSFEPTILQFWSHVYSVVEDGLYVQLYNEPCLGWEKVEVPSGAIKFIPLGDYLFAGDPPLSDLWWIKGAPGFTSENWQKVTSTGIPSGEFLYPRTIFNGQIYGTVTYFNPSNLPHTTFDIYRSPDVGSTTMAWNKVVAGGFLDTQNHALGYLGVFKNKLIAITTETHNGLFGDTNQYLQGIEVWESSTGDPGSWTQVNTDGFGTEAGGIPPLHTHVNCNFGAAAEYNGYLYVGTKSHFGAEIWRYDGSGNTTGWTNVTPDTLGVPTPFGAGRVEDMVVFQDKLYVAEGFPTADLVNYDGTTWTVVESGPNPFDPANASILGLAVLPSRGIPPPGGSGSTGDKLFAVTDIMGVGYQFWSYPFPEDPLSCTVLKQATISVSPKTATNELGPGQTHTVIATVDAGSGVDFSQVWVGGRIEIEQANGVLTLIGFVGPDGLFGYKYTALQGPSGLDTDIITACFYNSDKLVCDEATKTWVDTTPPVITITSPQDGGKYLLNAVVTANYSIQDAVGVKQTTVTPDVAPGGSIPTSPLGMHTFTVAATDYGGNTATKSVTYKIVTPPIAKAGPDQTVLVGLPVTFDGTASSDPDGSIVSYAWTFGDGTTGAGPSPSHAYSSAGLKTVTLTVTDNDGLSGSDTLAVTVKTPLQGTQDLGSGVTSSLLPQDIKDGLNDKLVAAVNALNKGNGQAAINILKAFINMVNAQRGKALTNAQADSWVAEAQKIINSISAS